MIQLNLIAPPEILIPYPTQIPIPRILQITTLVPSIKAGVILRAQERRPVRLEEGFEAEGGGADYRGVDFDGSGGVLGMDI